MSRVTNQMSSDRPLKKAKHRQSNAMAALNVFFTVETTAAGIAERHEMEIGQTLMKMKFADWNYLDDHVKKLNKNTYVDEKMSIILSAHGSRIECPTLLDRSDMESLATVINKCVVQRSRLSDIGRTFMMLSDTDISYVVSCLRQCWRARCIDRDWIINRIDSDCMFSLTSRPYGLSLSKISLMLSAIGFRQHPTLVDVSMIPDRESIDVRVHEFQYDICVYIGHVFDDCVVPTIDPDDDTDTSD